MHVTRALRTGDVVSFSYDKNIRKKKDNDFFENDLEEDNKEADNKNIWKEEGAPSVPKIFRIRSDLLWEDVQREAKKDVDLEEYSHGAINGATPQRHWTSKKGKNLRIFLEGLASKMGMDPLLPDTWYKIPRKTLKKYKAGKAVLKLGGYITALLSLFPDIGLDVNKFTESIRLRKPFQDVQKRRDWFCNFAREKGFEPLQPNGWYSIPLEHLNTDSVKSILSYYSGDAVNALLSLFPEIGFDKSKFFYANKENRRVFFETLAYDNGFDPKNAKKWESISLKWKKFKSQGVQTIVNYYDGSLANALADVFPDIGIEPARFTGKYWGDIANQRKFFESFATINNFDPLVPDNWYKITGRRIKKEGGKGIVANYAGESASLALLASFPEIGLKKSKFIRHAKSIY